MSHASSTARGSRQSTASATGCSARIPRRQASIRASACSTRARQACCARRRSAWRSPSSARASIQSGSSCSRRTARAAFAACSAESPRRCGQPDGRSSSACRRSRISTRGCAELKAAAEAALAGADGRRARGGRGERAPCPRRPAARRQAAGRPPARPFGDRCQGPWREGFAAYEALRLALEQTALNVAAVHDRDLLQELLALFDAAYQRAKDAESASTSRTSSSARATCSNDEAVRRQRALRFWSMRWSTSSRTRTGSSARSSISSIRKSSSSSATSSSRSTGSGTRTWRSSESVAPDRRACCRCGRTTARGRSCSMS